MNIVIAGAGELGQLLAEKLTANQHDVVLIDSSGNTLDHINDSHSLEAKLIEGSCIDPDTLNRANVSNADVLLAMSGDDAANVLSCHIASKLGTQKTICRLNSAALFSDQSNLQPESCGIWKHFSPPDECVRKIAAVLENRFVLEEIRFSHPDAVMRVFLISRSSMLANARIKDIPMDPVLRESIRFAAIVREKQFIVPHGDTIFVPGDKVYIAGTADNVRKFIQWASDQAESRTSRIVIAGLSKIGIQLGQTLSRNGYNVRFIVKNPHGGEKLFETIRNDLLVVEGDSTDEEILLEAGTADCDAFISVDDDDGNILSCIMAKQLGAHKTISVTSRPEYIRIVPMMGSIDCAISSTLVAVNSVLRMLETGTMRVDAYLQMFHAQLTEFRVSNSSPLCGRSLASCKLPASTLFALLFRDDEIITPSGGTIFRPGDIVVSIVTPESEKEIAPLFPER